MRTTKMTLKKEVARAGTILIWAAICTHTVDCSYEIGNKPLLTIKDKEIIILLINHQALKEDSNPWILAKYPTK